MTGSIYPELEAFLKSEMLQLKLKSFIIKKASKNFDLPKEKVNEIYLNVRSKTKKEALNRGLAYLLLSSIFLLVGIKSTSGETGYIFLGGLVFGCAGMLTALGYFILAVKGLSK